MVTWTLSLARAPGERGGRGVQAQTFQKAQMVPGRAKPARAGSWGGQQRPLGRGELPGLC